MMVCPGCGVAHAEPQADTPLAQLNTLSADSAGWLAQAGLHVVADLSAVGAVEAYRRVEALGFKPSLNLLYALEGVLHNEHWLQSKRRHQAQLLAALQAARERAAA